jgi:hypothetical protein
MDIEKVKSLVEIAAKAANLTISHLEVKHDSYLGDDDKMDYLEVDGLVLYPTDVDVPALGGPRKAIGWAVDGHVVVRGRGRTLGDPGDPDTYDAVTIIEPEMTGKSGSGQEYKYPTPVGEAVKGLVLTLVEQNIENAFRADAEPEGDYNPDAIHA